jgi:hypothetical protein
VIFETSGLKAGYATWKRCDVDLRRKGCEVVGESTLKLWLWITRAALGQKEISFAFVVNSLEGSCSPNSWSFINLGIKTKERLKLTDWPRGFAPNHYKHHESLTTHFATFTCKQLQDKAERKLEASSELYKGLCKPWHA